MPHKPGVSIELRGNVSPASYLRPTYSEVQRCQSEQIYDFSTNSDWRSQSETLLTGGRSALTFALRGTNSGTLPETDQNHWGRKTLTLTARTFVTPEQLLLVHDYGPWNRTMIQKGIAPQGRCQQQNLGP